MSACRGYPLPLFATVGHFISYLLFHLPPLSRQTRVENLNRSSCFPFITGRSSFFASCPLHDRGHGSNTCLFSLLCVRCFPWLIARSIFWNFVLLLCTFPTLSGCVFLSGPFPACTVYTLARGFSFSVLFLVVFRSLFP